MSSNPEKRIRLTQHQTTEPLVESNTYERPPSPHLSSAHQPVLGDNQPPILYDQPFPIIQPALLPSTQPIPEDPLVELHQESELAWSVQSDILKELRTNVVGREFEEQEFEDRELEVEDSATDDSENSAKSASARGDCPLYKDAPITLHESFVSILTLVLTFKLSGVCMKAILDLIALHIPVNNLFRTSLQFFKDYFLHLQGPTSFEYYCSKCFVKLQSNTKCNKCFNSKVCYLVKLSMINQLGTLLKRKGFYSLLQFPSDTTSNDIKDVYNGQQYVNMIKDGRLGKDGKLSGQWYTDGAALYTSTSVSVWPLYISINELPYSERFKPENVLVPVIWCGPVKPPGNILFAAAYPELSQLNNGMEFSVQDYGQKNISFCLLSGTGDTPARSLALNLSQFNGEHSCQRCLQKGEPRQNCPGVRIFPYNPDEMVPRTVEGMKDYAIHATPDTPVMGVKGPSILAKLTPDFVRGTSIDAMHQTYGGFSKKVLKLLTTTKKKDSGKWNISEHTDTINYCLLSIKTPSHMDRVPRSLSELPFWKIKEHKAWFEHYSLPILQQVMPPRYLAHHATAVAAIQLLNADSVSRESLALSKQLLEAYIAQFSDFYSPKYLTMNFHLILHLYEIVLDLGPLWVSACFLLEAINGIILNLVHGTRWAERQIATSLQICLGLPDIVDNLRKSPSKNFCEKLMKQRKFVNSQEVDGMKIQGTPVPLQTSEIFELLSLTSLKYTTVFKFCSLKKGRYTYASADSQLTTKQDSSAAVYECDSAEQVGIINCFLQLRDCSCVSRCSCSCSLYVVMEKFHVILNFPTLIPNVLVPNTAQYTSLNCKTVIPAKALKSVCVKMCFGEKLFFSKPTNTHEYE